jgi:ferredoxin
MRISADRDTCIRAGHCLLNCGEVFDADEDGTVVLLTEVPPAELEDAVRSVVEQCPSGALSLEETGS